MPDDIYQVGAVTIRIGIDADGTDITEVEVSENVSILHALGAIAVAQRDLLDSVAFGEEHDE